MTVKTAKKFTHFIEDFRIFLKKGTILLICGILNREYCEIIGPQDIDLVRTRQQVIRWALHDTPRAATTYYRANAPTRSRALP